MRFMFLGHHRNEALVSVGYFKHSSAVFFFFFSFESNNKAEDDRQGERNKGDWRLHLSAEQPNNE